MKIQLPRIFCQTFFGCFYGRKKKNFFKRSKKSLSFCMNMENPMSIQAKMFPGLYIAEFTCNFEK